jgi:HSP20 family protein
MFKVFSFGLGEMFNLNNLEKIGGVMHSFLDNIDIKEFIEENGENLGYGIYEGREEEKNNFIELKQYEDLYVLNIDLKGINLRELSIRYDPGVLEINLNRSEVEKLGIGMLARSMLVKRAYNKKFEDIEDIETNQILKTIDNGILSIRMPKKYALENIIDVDFYEDNVDK